MASWTTRAGTPPGPLSLNARSANARWMAPMPATAPPSSSKPSRANSSTSARASTPETLTDRAVGLEAAAISSPAQRVAHAIALLSPRRLSRAPGPKAPRRESPQLLAIGDEVDRDDAVVGGGEAHDGDRMAPGHDHEPCRT